MAEVKSETVREVDARGEICPYPLLMAQKGMKAIKPGERLLVKVDYPKSSEDIPRWAEEAGHKVVALEKRDDSEWEIVLQKGEG